MGCSHRRHWNRLAGRAAASWSSDKRSSLLDNCQRPVSSCLKSLCLPTEIRNTINSFSLSTERTGFLGLPPAKKWVLYGETGSGLGRPHTVFSTYLAASGVSRRLCTPPEEPTHTPLLCSLGHWVLGSRVAPAEHDLCSNVATLLTEAATQASVYHQHGVCRG